MNPLRIFKKRNRGAAKLPGIVIIIPTSGEFPIIARAAEPSPEYKKLANDLEWLEFALARIANRVDTFKFDKAA